MADLYQRAWELLLARIKSREYWSDEDVQRMMLECLVEAGNPYAAEPLSNLEAGCRCGGYRHTACGPPIPERSW